MNTSEHYTRAGWRRGGLRRAVLTLLCVAWANPWAVSFAGDPSAGRTSPPPVQLVRVPLPVTGEVDRRLRSTIEELLGGWQNWPQEGQRPVLVLEFRGDGSEGRSSQFERSLSLARFLSGGDLSRVRTVAWLTGSVQGHAVLPVLACEEIIVSPDGALGRAGIAEPHIDGTIRGAYQDMAERRRTVPVPVVLGMLDDRLAIYRVQTLDGVRYAVEDDLEALKQEVVASAVERIVPVGEMANFSGGQLRLELGFASHMARDRAELATALRVPPASIVEDPTLGQGRRPLRVDVSGAIQKDSISWIERSLREQIDQHHVNFVCVVIDSPGGSLADSLRLASYLAGLDPGRVRTVAYVPTEARSDAALIALACDHLVVGEQAVLGGPGHQRIEVRQLEDIQPALREMAQQKQRGWSLMMAMVDQNLRVQRFTQQGTGAARYFAPAEFAEQADADQWQAGGELPIRGGLRSAELMETGLAVMQVADFGELRAAYQLEGTLPGVRPNWAHRLIEFLASPKVAGALLFIGWFALMFEFMSPGLGLPGFLAGLCFLVFFWSAVLNGTAGWLEILLFAAGVVCLALEIFVLPGLGAFGIGGAALIVASIVLASQTFVVPRNPYEWSQVPNSLLLVSAAGAGIIASLICMPRLLTHAPLFRRIALETPDEIQTENIRYLESLVHLDYLLGKRGLTTTPLTPSGKARFGDEVVDVVSDGDLVPAGSDVTVAEVRGSEVVVRTIS